MKTGRRTVIKSLAIIVTLGIASQVKFVPTAYADKLKPVAEDNATAKMLGYASDHTKVDTTKYPRKAGQSDMKCSTCLLYQSLGDGDTLESGEKADWGKCSIFPNMVVPANGWCNSWSKKG